MIIEIDGYVQQTLLVGEACSKSQLKKKYLKAKKLSHDLNNLPKIFCKLYHFEELLYNTDMEVSFVIDTDTNRIYSPSY